MIYYRYNSVETFRIVIARPKVEEALENPVQSGAEGARLACKLNLSGKRTEQIPFMRLHIYGICIMSPELPIFGSFLFLGG